MARVLANRLQLFISDLIGPEQTSAVKGRSIQDNLHLVREVLEETEDGTEAAPINLDQSKAFDRVDHRFLASVLETAGFQPSGSGAGEQKAFEGVRDRAIGPADMPNCARCCSGWEETVEHTFYNSERVRPFWDHIGEWTARIEPKQLVLLDLGYVVDNVLPPIQGQKRVVFLTILAATRMVIWTTRKKGLYDDAKISHRNLILFFRHQLRVKLDAIENVWIASHSTIGG